MNVLENAEGKVDLDLEEIQRVQRETPQGKIRRV